jgi:alcohol dehydrogenase class IV
MDDSKPRTFHLPTRVVTGLGCSQTLGQEARRLGARALLVCSRGTAERSGFLDPLLSSLAGADVPVHLFAQVQGEPTLQLVERGIVQVHEQGCDLVIGIGGGSAMDAAKAIAGLAPLLARAGAGSVADYHQGRAPEGPGLPLITVPTTAGSGAEVTKNAVLSDPSRQFKASIRTEEWFARLTLVDPELTRTLPPSATAASGSDALCQAIESYVSIGASPATDGLAGEAIRRIGRSLVQAYRHGDDLEARADMLYGSLLAGMALANARLGGVHGLAHPLGIRFNIPHGTICGLLLPYVMAHNLPWAEAKYAQITRWLDEAAGRPSPATAQWTAEEIRQMAAQAPDRVRDLLVQIDLPLRLRPFGVSEADFLVIIEESLPSGSLKHNPRPLNAEDLQAILTAAL